MRDGWLKKSGTTPSDLKKELIQRIYVKVQLDAKVRDENKAARLGGDDDEDADAEADDEENDADIPDDAELLQTDADDAASVAAVAAAASPSVASGGMDLEFSCQDCGTTWIKPAVEVDEMKQSGFVVCCDSCQKKILLFRDVSRKIANRQSANRKRPLPHLTLYQSLENYAQQETAHAWRGHGWYDGDIALQMFNDWKVLR